MEAVYYSSRGYDKAEDDKEKITKTTMCSHDLHLKIRHLEALSFCLFCHNLCTNKTFFIINTYFKLAP